MAKHLIYIIIQNNNMKVKDMIDYPLLSKRSNIGYEEENFIQLNDLSGRGDNGLVDIAKTTSADFFLFDGMYSEELKAKILDLKDEYSFFSFVYSGVFGEKYINSELDYLYSHFKSKTIFIVYDNNSDLVPFQEVYLISKKKKFPG